MILKEMLHELREIRKELQTIRNRMELFSKVKLDGLAIAQAVQKSSYDTFPKGGDTF